MTRQLTAAGIAKIRPGKVRREFRDATSGLSLVIQPSGHKSWVMRFRRPDGRPCKLTLGSVDLQAKELTEAPEIGMPLSLASARWLAAEVNRQRAMGRDVIADMAVTKQRRRIDVETKAYTYPAAVRQFIDEYARKKNRGWRETARVLGVDYRKDDGEPTEIKSSLASRWRDRPVGEINSDDVYTAVDEARRHSIAGLNKRNEGISDARGRSVARALGKLFGWLHQHRKLTANPCLGMYVPPPSAKRERRLSEDEIRVFWKCSGELGYPFCGLFRLLLLTGCRRDEVAGLDRQELDGKRWIIPGERTKNKRGFLVPLSPEARELISNASEFAGNSGHLFTTNDRTPVSGFSKVKKRLDALMKKESGEAFRPWRLHDLRRTAASGMASIKIAPHIVESCLNHISGFRSGVAGVYNLYEYEDEKREALAAWATHLDQLVSGDAPANVVSIRGKR